MNNPIQATKRITREDEIIKADKDSRMWLKDNPSNVKALQRTFLIISWLKILSYRKKNPSMKNPTEKSCKKLEKKTLKNIRGTFCNLHCYFCDVQRFK